MIFVIAFFLIFGLYSEGQYSSDDNELITCTKLKKLDVKQRLNLAQPKKFGFLPGGSAPSDKFPKFGNKSQKGIVSDRLNSKPPQSRIYHGVKGTFNQPLMQRLGGNIGPQKPRNLLPSRNIIPSLESVAPRVDPTLGSRRTASSTPMPPPFPKPATAIEPEWMRMKRSIMNDSKGSSVKIVQQSTRELSTLSRFSKIVKLDRSVNGTVFRNQYDAFIHHAPLKNQRKIDPHYVRPKMTKVDIRSHAKYRASNSLLINSDRVRSSRSTIENVSVKVVKQIDYVNDRVITVPVNIEPKLAAPVQNRLGSVLKNRSANQVAPVNKKHSWKELSDSCDEEVVDPSTIKRKKLKKLERRKSPAEFDVKRSARFEKYNGVVRSAVVLTDSTNQCSSSGIKAPVMQSLIIASDITKRSENENPVVTSLALCSTTTDLIEDVSDQSDHDDDEEQKRDRLSPRHCQSKVFSDAKAAEAMQKEQTDAENKALREENQTELPLTECVTREEPYNRDEEENTDDGNESDSSNSSSSSSSSCSSSSSSSSSTHIQGHSNLHLNSTCQVKGGLTCPVLRKRQLSTGINPSSDSSDGEANDLNRSTGASRIPLEPRCMASAKYKASAVNQNNSGTATLGEEVSQNRKCPSRSSYDLYKLEKDKLGINSNLSSMSAPICEGKQTWENGEIRSSVQCVSCKSEVVKSAVEVLDVPKPWRKTEPVKTSQCKKTELNKEEEKVPECMEVAVSSKHGSKKMPYKKTAVPKSGTNKPTQMSRPNNGVETKHKEVPVSAKLSTVCNTYNVYQSPIAMSNKFISQATSNNGGQTSAGSEGDQTQQQEQTSKDNSDAGGHPFYQMSSGAVSEAEKQNQPVTFPHPDYDAHSAAVVALSGMRQFPIELPVSSMYVGDLPVLPSSRVLPLPVCTSSLLSTGSYHMPRPHPSLDTSAAVAITSSVGRPSPLLSFPAMFPAWDGGSLSQPPPSNNNEERVMMKYLPWCFNAESSPALSELTPYFAQFWDSFLPCTHPDAKLARQVSVGLLESAIVFKEGQGEKVELHLKIMLNLLKNLKNFE